MPFMSHPEHGYHQATSAEAEEMLKNGWKFDVHPLEKNPNAKVKQAEKAIEPVAVETKTDILQSLVRRPGRPRKTDDSDLV